MVDMSHTPALKVDFAQLATVDNDFAKYYNVYQDHGFDFQDPDAVRQLAKSTLKYYYAIEIDLPDDRLCPAIPIRLEYVQFIQNLIYTTRPSFTDEYESKCPVLGIDIGIGSSCVYPLLSCAIHKQWQFIGTDIDTQNLNFARQNIERNKFTSRISLHKVNPHGLLLPLEQLGTQHADFVMCNPPFYGSNEELHATGTEKDQPPNAVCTGADVEMITEGGEVGFVRRILEDSLKHKEKIQWYTAMLGKLSSVGAIVEQLKRLEITNYAVTVLKTGGNTRRWAIAWSFGDLRTTNTVGRGLAKGNPWLTEMTVSLHGQEADSAGAAIDNALKDLPVRWTWKKEDLSGICRIKEHVWSRAARRRRERFGAPETLASETLAAKDIKMVVGITVDGEAGSVRLRWFKGSDQALFESFVGLVQNMFR